LAGLGDRVSSWLESDGDKARAAMSAYGGLRELPYRDRGGIGDRVPLLQRGDKRRIEGRVDGTLGRGVEGTMAMLMVGEVVKTGQYGNQERSWKPFTIATAKVPRAKQFLPLLICQERGGLRVLEGVEDKLLHEGQRRVTLESVAFDERYELFVGEETDQNWLLQLFSPSFIVWLTETAPHGFAFEYGGGTVLASFDGYQMETEQLDALREALVTVVHNMREQVVEALGRNPARSDQPKA
jgi:hypothetical protein